MIPREPRQREAPLFLARRSYRRRRLMDGARLLPVAGALLFMLPMLWFAQGGDGTAETGAQTARGGLYIFSVWLVLIVCAALISRPLMRSEDPDRDASLEPDPRHSAPAEPGTQARGSTDHSRAATSIFRK